MLLRTTSQTDYFIPVSDFASGAAQPGISGAISVSAGMNLLLADALSHLLTASIHPAIRPCIHCQLTFIRQ